MTDKLEDWYGTRQTTNNILLVPHIEEHSWFLLGFLVICIILTLTTN